MYTMTIINRTYSDMPYNTQTLSKYTLPFTLIAYLSLSVCFLSQSNPISALPIGIYVCLTLLGLRPADKLLPCLFYLKCVPAYLRVCLSVSLSFCPSFHLSACLQWRNYAGGSLKQTLGAYLVAPSLRKNGANN